jgi:chemotaxis signal transduction protein
MSLKVHQNGLDPRVLQLRANFDAAFAEAPTAIVQESAVFLALKVGGDPYALRATEINGLARGRKAALLPLAPKGFMGFSGVRGVLLPIWSLAILLGYSQEGSADWQVQASGEDPWGLAFDGFDGTMNLALESLRPYACQGSMAAFVRQAAHNQDIPRPILELSLIGEHIRSKTLSAFPKELL